MKRYSTATMTTATDIGSLITETAEICGGRPRIAGTGISVRRIVGWYKLGWSPEEIADRIGHISLAQVHAALTYYHANQQAMETEMAEEAAEEERLEHEHRTARKKT
jgi:uncharacterized protein (DUF433 family)